MNIFQNTLYLSNLCEDFGSNIFILCISRLYNYKSLLIFFP